VTVKIGSIVFSRSSYVIIAKHANVDFVCGPHTGLRNSLAQSVFDSVGGQQTPSHMVVHRLDHATSGLCVFSLTSSSASSLHELFRTRKVVKRYQCIVDTRALPNHSPLNHGDAGEISLPLMKRKGVPLLHMPKGRESCSASGGNTNGGATSTWKVLERGVGCARLEVSPLTGRTHQIRLHCAHGLNAPILGDNLYGTLGNEPFHLLLKGRPPPTCPESLSAHEAVREEFEELQARVSRAPRPTLRSCPFLGSGQSGSLPRTLLHSAFLSFDDIDGGGAESTSWSSSLPPQSVESGWALEDARGFLLQDWGGGGVTNGLFHAKVHAGRATFTLPAPF